MRRSLRAALALGAIAVGAVPEAGAQVLAAAQLFTMPGKGNCIACHQVPAGAGPATRADLGPRLEGARMRALGAPALKALIADPTVANPDTLMPPFGRHRILDAGEIDRLVKYLLALP